MEHRSLGDLRDSANISIAPHAQGNLLSRRERLERFAALLERHEGRLRPLERIEYRPRAEVESMRLDDSPLTIAYNDPVLRADGLASDKLGDAISFFDLSHSEAHNLLCDCHYAAGMTPHNVAARARAIARKRTWGEVWAAARSAFSRWSTRT
jgi:hypothetical protein